MRDIKKLRFQLVGKVFDLDMVNLILNKNGYKEINLNSNSLYTLIEYGLINVDNLIITTALEEFEGELYFTVVNITEKYEGD